MTKAVLVAGQRNKETDMECTQDLHHQQQLEQQQQEIVTKEQLDMIAFKCLGVAQSMKDMQGMNDTRVLLISQKRLIELATEYETLRKRYLEQK
jgi:hypothetical protein